MNSILLTIGITVINNQVNNLLINILPNIVHKNVEIICIMDSITNYNFNVIKKKTKNVNNILLIRTKNKNVSINRNLIINNSKGKILTFIDGDDQICLNYPNKIIDKWKEKKTDIIVFNYFFKKNNKLYCKENIFWKKTTKFICSIQSMEICTKVFLTEIIKNNNIFFIESNYKISEDMYFIISYFRYVNSISTINDNLYIYVNNNESSTSSMSDVYKLESTLFYLAKLLEIVEKGVFFIIYINKIFDFLIRVKRKKFNSNIISYIKKIKEKKLKTLSFSKGWKFFLKCLYVKMKCLFI